eukprot:TRINITY_DN8412_c0_g1_i1.p7 TRINITY_DN8412_c0_g1~~TRINITY_DN8412_c0_g1_i1.p7  ORF type:complete len:122 (+),score=16.19 TRINITY_DN8412_c0_g1_i1:120-485(+)
MPSLVGSEMCIRDRYQRRVHGHVHVDQRDVVLCQFVTDMDEGLLLDIVLCIHRGEELVIRVLGNDLPLFKGQAFVDHDLAPTQLDTKVLLEAGHNEFALEEELVQFALVDKGDLLRTKQRS